MFAKIQLILPPMTSNRISPNTTRVDVIGGNIIVQMNFNEVN